MSRTATRMLGNGKMEIISRRPACLNSCCCYCGVNGTKPVAADETVNPVTRKSFDVLSVLGAGAYGKVFLVRKTDGADSGCLYAMKELPKDKIIKSKKITQWTIMERQVLEAVRHTPFIIGLNYAFQTNDKLHLILDYVCGGDLFTHFCNRQQFPEEEVRFYVGEVVLALEQLHKIGVIYRDLKPENILIDAQGHIVLTDFGLCKKFSPSETPRTYSHCGTLEYMAPEVIQGPSGHNMAADWWSTGILTCELLAGDHPFNVAGKRKYKERVRRRILTAEPRIPSGISPEASDFILKLLVKDPEERLGRGESGAEDVKRHPFFRELDWSALGQKRIPAPFAPILSDKMVETHISEEPATRSKSRRTAPRSSDNTFRGYSFVRPSMLRENVTSCLLTGDSILNSEYILSCKFGESPFFENYELDLKKGILGQGSFSVCHKCTNRQTGNEFAVKIMNQKIDSIQEIKLLLMCQDHPNIVSLHEVYYDEAHTYIVLELLYGGELLDRIRKKGRFTETEASQVMRKLVSALNFMHSCGVVHRDLKPENILFTDDSEQADIKIVDFGFAGLKQENQTMHAPCFTLQYAAPEVLKEAFSSGTDGYDENCDLWSLGVILYNMLCGHTPYQVQSGDDCAAVMARIKGEELSSNIDALDHISSEAKYVTKGLLTVDPKDRLKMSDLINNEWVQGCSVILEPTTLLLIPDILAYSAETDIHQADQEELIVQIVPDDEQAQRTWTVGLSTDTCSYSMPSTHSAPSSSGTPLSEVTSRSLSEPVIGYVKEDKSNNSDLLLFVTSDGPVIQSRKRKRSEAASSVFGTCENSYVDIDGDNDNVKRKKSEMYSLIIE